MRTLFAVVAGQGGRMSGRAWEETLWRMLFPLLRSVHHTAATASREEAMPHAACPCLTRPEAPCEACSTVAALPLCRWHTNEVLRLLLARSAEQVVRNRPCSQHCIVPDMTT